MKVLLTGANGFTGPYITREIQKHGWDVVTLGRLSSKNDFYHDFRAPLQDNLLADLGHIDYIIHNGAEVHAPRSIADPQSFVQSNAVGVFNMLEAARKLEVRGFLYVSSSEVFGPATKDQFFTDDQPLNPVNPYAAAKAGGEVLCQSYFKCFGVSTITVRPSNIFGVGQDDRKFIPMVLRKLKANEVITIQTSGNEICSRQWIHAENYANAVMHLLTHGVAGQAYNIAGLTQDNCELVQKIAHILGTTPTIEFVDMPYGQVVHNHMDDSKLRGIWKQPVFFEDSLAHTIKDAYDSSNAQ